MNTLNLRFPGGLTKCLTLSYDDGVEQDMRLCSLMKEHGIAGTFNISTGRYSPEGKQFEPSRVHRPMTQRQCFDTYKNEPLFEVATHGLKHKWQDEIPMSEVIHEVSEDRRNIEEQYGTVCRGHAYPFGNYSDGVMNALKCCGIVYARTINSTHKFDIPKNWLELNPTCHHNDPMLSELTDKFLNKEVKHAPYLFYLWGHSFEFESCDNWNVIEEFFARVGGRSDIWYATNIQVYDYVHAFGELIFSADGKTVYNPTATDIYVSVDTGEAVKIAAGTTVKL